MRHVVLASVVAVIAAVGLMSSVRGAANDASAALLNDDYTGLPLGMFSGGVVGALTEYHYVPEACAPRGNWVVSTYRTDGSQRAWRIVADEKTGERFMHQSYLAQPAERTYMRPMVVAGDETWSDYEVETKFAPAIDDGGMSGVAFRYRNDRRYYFAGVAGQRAILKKIDQGTSFRKLNETILAEKPLAWKAGEFLTVKITVAGDRLRATVGDVTLEAQDATFPLGKISLTSDMPTRFGGVHVTCSAETKRQIDDAIAKRKSDEDAAVAANPRMVLWKKLSFRNFGVGRNLRFGDLDADGDIDVLVAQQKRHGPGDGHSEVGCLTAVNFEGDILWQNGPPDSWNYRLTNDVAVQVHDLDGDGKNEVVYCRDFELVVADGATGKTKHKVPTPSTPPDALQQQKRYPRILGDSLLFADLRGTGHRRDIVLKDRYRTIWTFNDRLESLWMLRLNTGHFPFPHDVDGDGREEVVVGYALVSPDGKELWSNDQPLEDHADGVAIVRLKDGDEKRLLCAASDEGFFIADAASGKILKHHQIGHAQAFSVADYDPAKPGLEIATSNFWGNQGIVHLFDSGGNLYHDAEPSQHGSLLLPVNWTGEAREYWALSASPIHGGLFDAMARRVVRFPADGHPEMCVAVLDVTGDCRDEIIVWDPWELWVYTQSDGPKSGRLYKPTRNPLCNESNYKTTVSLPGWSQ
jgi:hypothetical protein